MKPAPVDGEKPCFERLSGVEESRGDSNIYF